MPALVEKYREIQQQLYDAKDALQQRPAYERLYDPRLRQNTLHATVFYEGFDPIDDHSPRTQLMLIYVSVKRYDAVRISESQGTSKCPMHVKRALPNVSESSYGEHGDDLPDKDEEGDTRYTTCESLHTGHAFTRSLRPALWHRSV